MIFKHKDSSEHRLAELEGRLKGAKLNVAERKRLEKDLAILKAGEKGERDTAYFIDFELKDTKNWAVIHDLRIEHGGRVAQIDHLLINRLLEIYVVESKSFRSKVRYANGGWERLNFSHWEGIPSPVEQNARHILVLEKLVQDEKLAPSRFGLSPTYLNVVAVQPSCSVVGQIPCDARVYRTDALVRKVLDVDVPLLWPLKIISAETLHAFAHMLVTYHEAASSSAPNQSDILQESFETPPFVEQTCQNCGGPISAAEVSFSRMKKAVFAGRLLCRKCQTYARKSAEPAKQVPCEPDLEVAGRCAKCATTVDRKVVAFCRFNSKRFDGEVLCRECQSRVDH